MGKALTAMIIGKVQSNCDQGRGEWVTARKFRARTAESATCESRLQHIPRIIRPGSATNIRAVFRKEFKKALQGGASLDRQMTRHPATMAKGIAMSQYHCGNSSFICGIPARTRTEPTMIEVIKPRARSRGAVASSRGKGILK